MQIKLGNILMFHEQSWHELLIITDKKLLISIWTNNFFSADPRTKAAIIK